MLSRDWKRPLGWGLVGIQTVLLALLTDEEVRAWRRGTKSAPGVVVTMAGGFMMARASLGLGRALRAHPAPAKDAILRTDGLYGLARHPIYAGLLILAAGMALMGRSRRAAGTWCALALLLTLKTHLEEGPADGAVRRLRGLQAAYAPVHSSHPWVDASSPPLGEQAALVSSRAAAPSTDRHHHPIVGSGWCRGRTE